MADGGALKYRAFISYSHADTRSAKRIHRWLESFRIDKDLVGRNTQIGAIPKTLRPIFRDRDDFSVDQSLSAATLSALDVSAALVVLCSPASAKSKYVNEEVRLFKSRHPTRPVIPVIVDGKPNDADEECFPPALKFGLDANGQISTSPADVLAADTRNNGDGPALAFSKIVAGLLDVPSDDIFRRAEKARQKSVRVRNGIIGALSIFLIVASGSAIYAWQQLKNNEAFTDETLKVTSGIVSSAVRQAETYGIPRNLTLQLLTEAERLFDVMARRGRETPQLRHRRVWMLIELTRNYSMLGQTDKEGLRAIEAHRLMTALAAENLSNSLWQNDLSVTHGILADALNRQGKIKEALDNYRISSAILKRISDADPSNTKWLDSLAIVHRRLGNALKNQGRIMEALGHYQSGALIDERLVALQPSSSRWQINLSVAYRNIGSIQATQGRPDAALQSFRQSLEIAARFGAEHNAAPSREPRTIRVYRALGAG